MFKSEVGRACNVCLFGKELGSYPVGCCHKAKATACTGGTSQTPRYSCNGFHQEVKRPKDYCKSRLPSFILAFPANTNTR